jgi:Pvc16 N-terminal domain/Carboxypeptidase regulatory-like domain
MAVSIAVPLNTMLADLDETLRRMLVHELGRHGFDGVKVAFDAPTKEWANQLSTPAVNLYLYDLREAVKRRHSEWTTRRENGRSHDVRPPLRLEVSYAVTAWTRTVEDEHRLLSQVLAVLYAYHTLPESALVGTLANGAQRFPLETSIGQPRADGKVDFWSSVGAQYKASLDYVVLASCESGTRLERGPDSEGQTFRFRDPSGGRSAVEERHTVIGAVRDPAGKPVEGAWVMLPDSGGVAVTDKQGRFRFGGVLAGEHRCVARGARGEEVEVSLTVPGAAALTLAVPSASR